MDISAIVLTRDEERNIARCLSSLDFCREIIVIDSGSTDRTMDIARNFTSKVFEHKFEGYGRQRNWGIQQCSCDWILVLDADEQVSPELKNEIINLQPAEIVKGYYINRITQYMGRWIKHSGWYPQYVLRLFDRRCAAYNQAAVHESVEIDALTAKLQSPIQHYSYRDLSHHLRKIDDYTNKRAAERYAEGRRFNLAKAILAPPGEFLKKYLLKRGILDGIPGLIVAVTSAYYVFLKQAKLYEYQKAREESGCK